MIAIKVVVLLGLIVAIATAWPENIVGGVAPVTDLKEAEEELNTSLTKLAAGDGPNYKLGKVYTASRQVVSGTLTKIDADLVDKDAKTKRCNVSIWSRPWLDNGIEVTFACPDEPTLIKKHSA